MCTIVYTFAIVTKRHAILIAKRALADPSEDSIITTNPAPKITPTNFTTNSVWAKNGHGLMQKRLKP